MRESHVYCEIVSANALWEDVASLDPKGIILSGGPASVYDPDAPLAPIWVYECGLPVLLPTLHLSTDNAAMIAVAGLRRLRAGVTASLDLNADAALTL